MKDSKQIIIVSDIDGTIMDHQYSLYPVMDTINELKSNKIPIVFCTSKTSQEVLKIRAEADINDPYIVENGGAIYSSKNNSFFPFEQYILGKSVNDLLPIFSKISRDINFDLIKFSDLSFNEIHKLTGLNKKNIELAIDREWSVPFLNPPERLKSDLYNSCSKYNVSIYQGNLMSHLVSNNCNKGIAVKTLINISNMNDVKVIALGDSQNDISFLDVADISIVVPGINGINKALKSGVDKGKYIVAPDVNGFGWSKIISRLVLDRF